MPVSSVDPSLHSLRILLSVYGLTQRELADGAGITDAYLSRILSGKLPAPRQTLQRLMDVLHDHARARVEAARLSQGLPPKVEDPAALRQIAGLVCATKGGSDAS